MGALFPPRLGCQEESLDRPVLLGPFRRTDDRTDGFCCVGSMAPAALAGGFQMNSSTPFSPTQEILILSAVACFLLLACWNLVKNYHPRFRKGDFRYTPLALAFLALIVATESIVVLYDPYLVKRHPLWVPVPPMFALVIFAVFARIDEKRE